MAHALSNLGLLLSAYYTRTRAKKFSMRTSDSRQDIALKEAEECFLVGADLVHEDVVVACIPVLLDLLAIPVRVWAARNDRSHVLGRDHAGRPLKVLRAR